MTDAAPDPAPPFDPARFRPAPLAGRGHRVDVGGFAQPIEPTDSAADLVESLPDFLGARALRGLAAAIAAAAADERKVLWGLGGHVIKVGLGPLLIDLHTRGFAHGFVLNGAAAIHDAEIAMGGSTSEDVGAGLFDGTYGSSDETGTLFAEAAARAQADNIGLGNRRRAHAGRPRTGASTALAAVSCCPTRHSGHDARGRRHGHRAHASGVPRRRHRRGNP